MFLSMPESMLVATQSFHRTHFRRRCRTIGQRSVKKVPCWLVQSNHRILSGTLGYSCAVADSVTWMHHHLRPGWEPREHLCDAIVAVSDLDYRRARSAPIDRKERPIVTLSK